MPQNICSLCVDKISDFYEYRLMCAATNLQTRTILNLPLVEPSRKQVRMCDFGCGGNLLNDSFSSLVLRPKPT